MATFSYLAYFPVRCSSNRDSYDPNKQKLNNIKINGTSTKSTTKQVEAGVTTTFTSVASVTANGYMTEQKVRQNIPTTKQSVDHFRQGITIEGGIGYRQRVVVRSYEVGPDKTATLESILNLLQETALNHVWMSGLLSDGFGATHGMMKNDLIWVVSRMQVQIDQYGIWGEVLEIDTWVRASGKNGMKRDWLIRSQATGQVFARATSTWVMMNRKTRRLSKMPEEVRAEIAPWFIGKQAIADDVPEKIVKLDNKAKYVNRDLKPKRSDLDMNQHVNNVKYVRWMLETVPDHILESHQLSGIILEYRRECGNSDIVQSLCDPDEEGMLIEGLKQQENRDMNLMNGFSLAAGILEGGGFLGFEKQPLRYTHLLQINGETKNEEIVRGRTTWKKKSPTTPFSSM
ncbi:palmitoyl-acyl carrier protein thioesterase, chloroplastic-like [Prunus avium]|uniref:Acyl-[acyl-carrier-protein] hydrolase n=1 Tax=Prunus avium TaxID=42229 RepID=A0A6P5TAY0_PRUAV|nr:palmitoyl-acyl carrier protein thioesterase, chloroplastic-like [Prunus avium]